MHMMATHCCYSHHAYMESFSLHYPNGAPCCYTHYKYVILTPKYTHAHMLTPYSLCSPPLPWPSGSRVSSAHCHPLFLHHYLRWHRRLPCMEKKKPQVSPTSSLTAPIYFFHVALSPFFFSLRSFLFSSSTATHSGMILRLSWLPSESSLLEFSESLELLSSPELKSAIKARPELVTTF